MLIPYIIAAGFVIDLMHGIIDPAAIFACAVVFGPSLIMYAIRGDT